jgi:hypothetical protein
MKTTTMPPHGVMEHHDNGVHATLKESVFQIIQMLGPIV